MKYERLKLHIRPHGNEIVRYKAMGKVTEVFWSNRNLSSGCNIRKLDRDNYVDIRTGEVFEFNHITNRSEDVRGIKKSLGRLRDYLNTNVVDVSRCRWVTLTYAENMRNPERLYRDFQKFNQKMRYIYGNYEYITAAEPQGRGAWHLHVVMIFPDKAPYIPNKLMAEKWGQGFVKVKKLDDVDNVGAYLTAYLGDIEVSEAIELSGGDMRKIKGLGIKEVEVKQDGKEIKKSFIKGGRLHMYPPEFNLYRCSRGIKKPETESMTAAEAEKKVSAATLTYENTLQIADIESGFQSVLNYRYYNTARQNPQETKI